MNKPSYNIYVRFQDVSQERGWSQILLDSATSFADAVNILSSVDRNLLVDKLAAISASDNGSTYEKNEVTMMLGKVVDDELRLACDDYCIGKPDWLPAPTQTKTNFHRWWNTAGPKDLAHGLFGYDAVRPHKPISRRMLISCKISRDIIWYVANKLGYCDLYFTSSMNMLDLQINNLSLGMPFDETFVPAYDKTSEFRHRNSYLRSAHYDCRSAVEGMKWYAMNNIHIFANENVDRIFVRIIKSHVTMCMAVENEIMRHL